MPRLIAFLPAERVLVDAEDNSMAIIGVLGGLKVPATGELPEGTASPLVWFALAIWKGEPGDEGQAFEQRVEVLSPSGRLLVDGSATFRFTGQSSHRVRLRVAGFPVWEPGDYAIRLSLRKEGDDSWVEHATYPLTVVHVDPASFPGESKEFPPGA